MGGDQSEYNHSETGPVATAEQRAEELIELLVANEYAAAFSLFSDEVQSELIEEVEPFKVLIKPEPDSILAEFWRAMTSAYGSFDTISEIMHSSQDEHTVVTVTLEFERETLAVEVPVNSNGEITEWPFIPEYAPPAYVDDSRITERETTVETADLSLGATLTLPANAGTVPGIVLVHGAGGNDRDYTSGANKILKDLAWGLADRGIASLRYDKRNYVTDMPPKEVDFETVVTGDAVTAVDTLADIEEIDSECLFVVGHSLGGTCAPYIAEQHGKVSGIVNLDGSCIKSGPYSLVEGFRDHWQHRDPESEYAHEQLDQMEQTAERIETGEADPDETFGGRSTAWERHLMEYTDDWLATTRSLSVPFLIVKSGRFAPGVSAESVDTLRTKLPDDNVRVTYYEELNHYFQKGSQVPASLYESANFRTPPAEKVTSDIADFVFEIADNIG